MSLYHSKPICKLYYFEDIHNHWHLTFDKGESDSGLNSRTATLQDLNDGLCIGWMYDNVVIHVDEGLFLWNNTYSEYEDIEDVKDCILSRMEDKGSADGEYGNLYESIVGMRSWEIRSWLDNYEYGVVLG